MGLLHRDCQGSARQALRIVTIKESIITTYFNLWSQNLFVIKQIDQGRLPG